MLDIVIVNWNSDSQLRECLLSVSSTLEIKDIVSKIVVVDNGSTDGSQLGLSCGTMPVALIQIGNNIGFAAACNMGAALGESELILFLNPDTKIYDGSLKIPSKYISDNCTCGIVGIQMVDELNQISRTCSRFPSTHYFFNHCIGLDKLFPKWFYGTTMREWDHSYTRNVDQVIGAFFLVRRPLYEKLGGFDERFFVYYEEVDFCLRAKKLGYSSVYIADAKAYHRGGGSTSKVLGKRLAYTLKSRLIYGFKNLSLISAWSLLVLLIFIEPLTRLMWLVGTFRISEIKYLFEGYYLLFRELGSAIQVGLEARDSKT